MERSIRRGLLPLALFLASLWLVVAHGGCSLRPLSLECYQCPCGAPGYSCIQGRCLLDSNVASFTPIQLSQYIASKCMGPAEQPTVTPDGNSEAPPPDQSRPCQCPAGQQCDANNRCVPIPCPNGQPRQPDGSCPPTDPCATVQCPDGQKCDPATGRCTPQSSRTCGNTTCQPNECCNPNDQVCTVSCWACGDNKCGEGYTCDNNEGRCLKQGSSCRPTGSCTGTDQCCGRACVAVPIGPPGRREFVRGCACESDNQCAPNRECLRLEIEGRQYQLCSCLSHAECVGGGTCQRSGGVRACVYQQ